MNDEHPMPSGIYRLESRTDGDCALVVGEDGTWAFYLPGLDGLIAAHSGESAVKATGDGVVLGRSDFYGRGRSLLPR